MLMEKNLAKNGVFQIVKNILLRKRGHLHERSISIERFFKYQAYQMHL